MVLHQGRSHSMTMERHVVTFLCAVSQIERVLSPFVLSVQRTRRGSMMAGSLNSGILSISVLNLILRFGFPPNQPLIGTDVVCCRTC